MPSSFAITSPSNTITLNAKGQGDTTFTVTNTSGRALRGRARLVPKNTEAAAWLKLSDDPERDFDAGATQQYVVQVAVPATAAQGNYSFSLDMVGLDNPDENYTQGPSVVFQVTAAPVAVKKPFPWWILIIAAIVVVAAIAVASIVSSRRVIDTPTPTVDVNATAGFAATATADAVNAAATQEAINATTTAQQAEATATAESLATALARLNAADQAATAQAATAAADASAKATADANATAVAIANATAEASTNATAEANASAAATQAAIDAKATADAVPVPITIRNSGGYVLYFNVRYTVGGQEASQESERYPVGQERTLFIPASATAISIRVQIVAGVERTFTMPSATRTCYRFTGTTLFPGVDAC